MTVILHCTIMAQRFNKDIYKLRAIPWGEGELILDGDSTTMKSTIGPFGCKMAAGRTNIEVLSKHLFMWSMSIGGRSMVNLMWGYMASLAFGFMVGGIKMKTVRKWERNSNEYQ
jgi:hypothetical protein